MAPIITKEGNWVEYPWLPMSSGPFLFDVEMGVEQCGGSDTLSPDYATVYITEQGVYVTNRNESNSCEKFFINKYGEMFGEWIAMEDRGRCLQRAIYVLKCASTKKDAPVERIGHNIAVLEDIQRGIIPTSARFVRKADFTLGHRVTLEDRPWPKEDTILCKEGDTSEDCTFYMSPSGAVRSAQALYSMHSFQRAMALVESLAEEDANNRYVAGLKTFLYSISRSEIGILPEPQY